MANPTQSAGASSAQVGLPASKTDLTINLQDNMTRLERFVLAGFQGIVTRDGKRVSNSAARDIVASAIAQLEEFDRALAGK